MILMAMATLFDAIEVLFEDEDVLVIDKPAGLVVTPGPGHSEEKTLVGWLLERYGERIRAVGKEKHRPGIVHRLDKDTSGVMVTAKTNAAFIWLIDQFSQRKVTKEYRAWVWGDVRSTLRAKGVTDDQFAVRAPIGRNPRNRFKFAVSTHGKPAFTRFKIEATTDCGGTTISKLGCYPVTGRTHQIRVHLKAMQRGVVGDAIYQSRGLQVKFAELVAQGRLQNRLHLHSLMLQFCLPQTDTAQVFTTALPNWQ